LNRFGFITPNEWNTFQQQHASPKAIALNNKMKELNKKNKFTHRLGAGGYEAAMPKWTKKEQELRVARIPNALEGCTLRTKNFICGHSRLDDSRQLITSSSEVTKVIKKAKTLIDKSHDKDVQPARINEEEFARQFLNFMRKNPQYVVQVHVP
jgi:hypothetical protein